MNQALWINYPVAARILAYLNDRTYDCPSQRPEGMLIVGDADNGKTLILQKLKSELQARATTDTGVIRIPLVLIQAPVGASRREFYGSLARAMHLPEIDRYPAARLRQRTIDAMRDAGTRAIAVDELHHLIAGGEARKRVIVDDLKYISNELGIPVFGAGTDRALMAISRDDQYLSRMPPIMIPPWEFNRPFLSLLTSLELALGIPSHGLVNPNTAELIHKHSRGLIGRIVRIAKAAWMEAKLRNSQTITEDDVNRAGFSDLPWLKT